VTEEAISNQPATKPKSTHTSQPAADKRLTALDAAAKVLGEVTEPMNCRQLIETMTEKNYWQPKAGNTPKNTLHAAISKKIKTKGSDSRFAKVGRGQFALAQKATIFCIPSPAVFWRGIFYYTGQQRVICFSP
jgi:hypothetical protein